MFCFNSVKNDGFLWLYQITLTKNKICNYSKLNYGNNNYLGHLKLNKDNFLTDYGIKNIKLISNKTKLKDEK